VGTPLIASAMLPVGEAPSAEGPLPVEAATVTNTEMAEPVVGVRLEGVTVNTVELCWVVMVMGAELVEA
jgi:hypothetical protein